LKKKEQINVVIVVVVVGEKGLPVSVS